MLALIFTRKLRPIIIGSDSGWLMLFGMMARPAATSLRTNSGVISFGMRWGNFLKTDGVNSLLGELLRTGVLLVEVVADNVVRHVRDAGAAHVFADGDEFHLRRDDAGAGVLQAA